jgi:hypothetical protein
VKAIASNIPVNRMARRLEGTEGRGGWELVHGTSFRGLSIVNKCNFVLHLHAVAYFSLLSVIYVLKYLLEYEPQRISQSSQG